MTLYRCICSRSIPRLLGDRWSLAGRPNTGRRWMGLVTRNWERKRFYRHVSVYESEGGLFGVKLDHRHLRTPLRKLFLIPSYPLALASAQEWAGQEGVVTPSLMHITSMCNTVLDNPNHRHRAEAMSMLANYLQSDTVSSRVTEPDALIGLQEKEWDPLITWFNERFCVNVESYTSLLPPTIPLGMLSTVMEFMSELNRWAFAGFELCVESSKSLILSCALFEERITCSQTADLARLEVKFQTSRWGEVEWQHTLEDSDLRARLAAGLIMKQLSN